MQRREDKRRKSKKKRREKEQPCHPVLMYKCVCLTVGVCKLKHKFNIKQNVSF